MGRIRRLLAHAPADVFVLMAFAFLLVAAEVRLRFLDSSQVLALFRKKIEKQPLASKKRTFLIHNGVLLLEKADRHLGWKPSCVRRTLVLLWLSRLLGLRVELQIGVSRIGQSFEAHIWLTHAGRVLETEAPATPSSSVLTEPS